MRKFLIAATATIIIIIVTGHGIAAIIFIIRHPRLRRRVAVTIIRPHRTDNF